MRFYSWAAAYDKATGLELPVNQHPQFIPIVHIGPIDSTTSNTQIVTMFEDQMYKCGASGHSSCPMMVQNLGWGKYRRRGPTGCGFDPALPNTGQKPVDISGGYVNLATVEANQDASNVYLLIKYLAANHGTDFPIVVHDNESDYFSLTSVNPDSGQWMGTDGGAVGFWNAMIADSRKSSVIVAPDPDNASSPGITMEQFEAARIAAGVSFDNTKSYYDDANKDFARFLTKYDVRHWTQYKGTGAIVKNYWPDALAVHYNTYAGYLPAPSGAPEWADSILAETGNPFYALRIPYNTWDVNSPALYLPWTDHWGHNALRAWLGKSDDYNGYVPLWTGTVAARSKEALPDVPFIPWVQIPGVSLQGGPVQTVAIFVEQCKALWLTGCDRVFPFPEPSTPQQSADLDTAITLLNEWIDSLSPPDTGGGGGTDSSFVSSVGFDYSEIAGDVQDIIAEFGRDLSLIRMSTVAADASKPWNATQDVEQTVQASGVVFPLRAGQIVPRTAAARNATAQAYVSAKAVAGFDLKSFNFMVDSFDDSRMMIVDCEEIRPGPTSLLYVLYLAGAV